jgi:hypothetical protein
MGPLAEQNHEPVLDLKFDVSHNPECPVKNNGRRLSSSVRFLDCPMYRETISRHDLSQKEIDDTWFSGEEYQYIKTVNTVTVRMMAGERPLLDPEIYCSRGLVSFNEEGLHTQRPDISVLTDNRLDPSFS